MTYLPPANEVWGKVIFLHQFVILFTGGACMVAWGACMVAPGGHAWLLRGGMRGCSGGGMRGCSGGPAWLLKGGMHGCSRGGGCSGGACVVARGGMHGFIWGGMRGFFSFSDTMRYSQWAGGTHPTGMHSCFLESCYLKRENKVGEQVFSQLLSCCFPYWSEGTSEFKQNIVSWFRSPWGTLCSPADLCNLLQSCTSTLGVKT